MTDIWKDDTRVNDDVLYAVGGAFVEYLYQKSGEKQFRSLIKCQTIENAWVAYGYKEFNELVSEFDKILGL